MFYKIDPSLLKEAEDNKYWYRNAEIECDIFIWTDENDRVERFQVWNDAYLIEWNHKTGLKSGQLDPGSNGFRSIQSPTYRYHQNYKDKNAQKIIDMLIAEKLSDANDSFIEFMINKISQLS